MKFNMATATIFISTRSITNQLPTEKG